MQARFYVPWFGRFASPDPARDQHFDNGQSWNIYSYVRNNPVMSTDPTGMVEKEREKNVNGGAVGPNGRSYIAAEEPPPASPAQTNEAASGGGGGAGTTTPPYKTTGQVPTPLPDKLDTFVKELAKQSGDNFPNGVTVTATTNGTHSKGSAHTTADAVDIRYNAKNPTKVMEAASLAGAKYGLDEKKHPSSLSSGPHFHFQLRPGKGGSMGDLNFRGDRVAPKLTTFDHLLIAVTTWLPFIGR